MNKQLAAASAQISELNLQMASLERSVTDTQQRIERERAEVRMLARALYAQPDSMLGLLFESSSLADAVTRIADLTSAADRAAATKRSLDRDMVRLAEQRDQLVADHDRAVTLQHQLEDQFSKLVAQAAAQRVTIPPTTSLSSTSLSAIQQIIMNAFASLGSAAQTWAMRVARCESNYNPYAVNSSSGASGLFQFLPSTWASSPYASQSVFNPTANAQAAAWLYNRSGGGPWSCK